MGQLQTRQHPTSLQGTYTVMGVTSETKLMVATAWAASATVSSYYIKREYSKTEKAEALQAIGQAYANHRVRLQIPQKCYDGTDEINGYFISEAVSGQDSGVDPAQPTTNYPLYGFSDIEYANGYFEKADLDIIAEGGIEIFTQEVTGAPFISRHQMTTDTSMLTLQERSIVRAVDWFSLFRAKKRLLLPEIQEHNSERKGETNESKKNSV